MSMVYGIESVNGARETWWMPSAPTGGPLEGVSSTRSDLTGTPSAPVYQKGRKDHDQGKRTPHRDRARPAPGGSSGEGDPALRHGSQVAHRPRRRSLRRQYRQSQPIARRHHDRAVPIQEAPLASRWTDVLPAPPPLRQPRQ